MALYLSTWLQRYAAGMIAAAFGWPAATALVLQSMASHLGGKDRPLEVWVGGESLAEQTGLTERTVSAALQRLQKGLLCGLAAMEIGARRGAAWVKTFPGLAVLWERYAGGDTAALRQLLDSAIADFIWVQTLPDLAS